VNGIECCPSSHLLATTADDGSIKLYNYTSYEILTQRKFTTGGTCLKWLSNSVDPESGTILAGFRDGVIRFLKLVPKLTNYEQQFSLNLLEVFKPHSKDVTHIAIDSKNSIIATGVRFLLNL
jgi:WD40 repeat protein